MPLILLMISLLAAAPAFAGASADPVLDANRSACGGRMPQAGTLRIDYTLTGDGLSGTAYSVIDRRSGAYAEGYSEGPTSGGDGFDGRLPWMRDQSGAITPQEGGDRVQVAVNQAYRNANLWWRSDRGGARIAYVGRHRADERDYDVLQITPKGGKAFEAWFDTKSHWLAKTIETSQFLTITTSFSDYRVESGILLAHTVASDSGGGPANIQVQTVARVRTSPTQSASAYAAPPWSRADTHLDGNATTVPFVLLNNHVYVDVTVNGQGPFRFIVDTGGHDILTPSTVAALGLNAQGESAAHGAGEATVSSGYVKVRSLRLGGVTLDDQTMTVLDFDAAGVEGFRTDGMIGFEVLRRFVTTIDYEARLLTLRDPRVFNGAHAGTPVHFKFYDHLPQVTGSIDGVAGRFDMDTGSRAEVDLTKPFVEAHRWRESHPKGVLAVTGWGVGGPGRSYAVRGRELELGAERQANIIVGLSTQNSGTFSDSNFDGNVGSGFLKRFVVTFDYERQVMYLKPRPGTVADSGVFDRSGMWVNAGAKGFDIMDVSAGGAAQAAGLKIGDAIGAVDGQPVSGADLSDFRRKLRNEPAGSRLKLSVHSGTDYRELILTLADQI